MKIFNWVQKKLHQNVIKDGVVKNVKKNEESEIEKNTKAILDQVGLVDVLENWVDGVLTIGTFGFDTLKCPEGDDDDDDEEEEEIEIEDGDDDETMDEDEEFAKNSVIVYQDEELDPLISSDRDAEVVGSDIIINEESGDDVLRVVVMDIDGGGGGAGKKRRTTLAELFEEEGDDIACIKKEGTKPDLEMDRNKYDKLMSGSRLSQLWFAKKIASSRPKDDEDSRPIKKLRQMMKRMLKRKIHPDVDVGKICKPSKNCEALESTHLLRFPGPVV